MSQLEVINDITEVHSAIKKIIANGQTVGLVPTMGALHAGHLSLVKQSKNQCDITVVTIFVNPMQFNQENDLVNYPRDLDSDISVLEQFAVDYVFSPSSEQMYPAGHSLSVDVGHLGRILEGRFRPGHFSGVATVLLKLFHLIPADVAFFGTKDYQQLKVVERVVEDTNLPIQVVGCPTVREEDGLAMSSRNRLLSPLDRQQAKCINEALEEAQQMADQGVRESRYILQQMRRHIHSADGKIDYVALVNPSTLQSIIKLKENTIALVAARMGSIRLIDNRLIRVGAG